jgi:hypothetical protein
LGHEVEFEHLLALEEGKSGVSTGFMITLDVADRQQNSMVSSNSKYETIAYHVKIRVELTDTGLMGSKPTLSRRMYFLHYLDMFAGRLVEAERLYVPCQPLLELDESYSNPFIID